MNCSTFLLCFAALFNDDVPPLPINYTMVAQYHHFTNAKQWEATRLTVPHTYITECLDHGRRLEILHKQDALTHNILERSYMIWDCRPVTDR